jgi:hypothetical protein
MQIGITTGTCTDAPPRSDLYSAISTAVENRYFKLRVPNKEKLDDWTMEVGVGGSRRIARHYMRDCMPANICIKRQDGGGDQRAGYARRAWRGEQSGDAGLD